MSDTDAERGKGGGSDAPPSGSAGPGPGAPGPAGGDSEPEVPGLLVRAGQVIVSPGRLFDRLRRRPVWLGALLLVAAAGLLWAALIPEELLVEAARRSLPSDMEAAEVERIARFSRYGNFVGAVVGPFLVATIVAGIVFFAYTVVLGGEATYRQTFSVTAHALIIPAAGTLLTVPLVLSTGDVQTVLALHLLVPDPDADAYLFRFLRA